MENKELEKKERTKSMTRSSESDAGEVTLAGLMALIKNANQNFTSELGQIKTELKGQLELNKTDIKTEIKGQLEQTKLDLQTGFKTELEIIDKELEVINKNQIDFVKSQTSFNTEITNTLDFIKDSCERSKSELKQEINDKLESFNVKQNELKNKIETDLSEIKYDLSIKILGNKDKIEESENRVHDLKNQIDNFESDINERYNEQELEISKNTKDISSIDKSVQISFNKVDASLEYFLKEIELLKENKNVQVNSREMEQKLNRLEKDLERFQQGLVMNADSIVQLQEESKLESLEQYKKIKENVVTKQEFEQRIQNSSNQQGISNFAISKDELPIFRGFEYENPLVFLKNVELYLSQVGNEQRKIQILRTCLQVELVGVGVTS